jgi:hypothetical protein
MKRIWKVKCNRLRWKNQIMCRFQKYDFSEDVQAYHFGKKRNMNEVNKKAFAQIKDSFHLLSDIFQVLEEPGNRLETVLLNYEEKQNFKDLGRCLEKLNDKFDDLNLLKIIQVLYSIGRLERNSKVGDILNSLMNKSVFFIMENTSELMALSNNSLEDLSFSLSRLQIRNAKINDCLEQETIKRLNSAEEKSLNDFKFMAKICTSFKIKKYASDQFMSQLEQVILESESEFFQSEALVFFPVLYLFGFLKQGSDKLWLYFENILQQIFDDLTPGQVVLAVKAFGNKEKGSHTLWNRISLFLIDNMIQLRVKEVSIVAQFFVVNSYKYSPISYRPSQLFWDALNLKLLDQIDGMTPENCWFVFRMILRTRQGSPKFYEQYSERMLPYLSSIKSDQLPYIFKGVKRATVQSHLVWDALQNTLVHRHVELNAEEISKCLKGFQRKHASQLTKLSQLIPEICLRHIGNLKGFEAAELIYLSGKIKIQNEQTWVLLELKILDYIPQLPYNELTKAVLGFGLARKGTETLWKQFLIAFFNQTEEQTKIRQFLKKRRFLYTINNFSRGFYILARENQIPSEYYSKFENITLKVLQNSGVVEFSFILSGFILGNTGSGHLTKLLLERLNVFVNEKAFTESERKVILKSFENYEKKRGESGMNFHSNRFEEVKEVMLMQNVCK